MDANKFEDVARELLGNEAYLIFQVDKLLSQCLKHLVQFEQDPSCLHSKNLFNDFQKSMVKNEN